MHKAQQQQLQQHIITHSHVQQTKLEVWNVPHGIERHLFAALLSFPNVLAHR